MSSSRASHRPTCRYFWQQDGNSAAAILEELTDIEMGKLTSSRISTYLTSEQKPDDCYAVRELDIADKHGKRHTAYNAKVNIFLSDDEPIFSACRMAQRIFFER